MLGRSWSVFTPRNRSGGVVGAAGINNTDIWTRRGAYGSTDDPDAVGSWRREPMELPRIQGADIAGRIIAVGEGVSQSRLGERVLVDNALYDGGEEELPSSNLIGSERDGGFAEYVAVPAKNAYAIDSPLTDEELATFPTAYVTALRMLNRARVAGGEMILVTGASGGVGTGVVQLAKVRGARVIALTSSGKEEEIRELGADAVVRRTTTDISADIAESAGSRPTEILHLAAT